MNEFVSKCHGTLNMIAVRGEIDVATREDLLLRVTTLADPAHGPVLLDLSRVTFIDCAGFEAVCSLNRQVRAAGGSVRITAVSPTVARLLELVESAGTPPQGLTWPATAPRAHRLGRRGGAHRARGRDVLAALCADARAVAGTSALDGRPGGGRAECRGPGHKALRAHRTAR